MTNKHIKFVIILCPIHIVSYDKSYPQANGQAKFLRFRRI